MLGGTDTTVFLLPLIRSSVIPAGCTEENLFVQRGPPMRLVRGEAAAAAAAAGRGEGR